MSLSKFTHFLCLSILLVGCSPTTQAQPQQLSSSADAAERGSTALVEISEDRALRLLVAALQERKIDIACLNFGSESDVEPGSKATSWEFVAREVHDEKCGGDPETSPVRDRYKVSSNGEVLVYDSAEGEYLSTDISEPGEA